MNLRTEFGLQADLPYVRSLASQPGLNMTDLAIPVTAAEHADLQRRDALTQPLGQLEAELRRTDPAYGGAWIDQAAGGVATVAFTHEPTADELRVVNSTVPSGSKLRLVVVRFSLAELMTVYATVGADMSSPTDPYHGKFVSAGVDPEKSTVAITILKDSPVGAEQVLQQRYGPAVSIQRGEPAQAS